MLFRRAAVSDAHHTATGIFIRLLLGSGGGEGQDQVAGLPSGVMAGAGVADPLARGAFAIMATSELVNLSALLDDIKCFALVR